MTFDITDTCESELLRQAIRAAHGQIKQRWSCLLSKPTASPSKSPATQSMRKREAHKLLHFHQVPLIGFQNCTFKSPISCSHLVNHLACPSFSHIHVPANESPPTHPSCITPLNFPADTRKHNTWLARLSTEHSRAGSEGRERASKTPIYNVNARANASTRHPARIPGFMGVRDAIHVRRFSRLLVLCTSRSLQL
jgi:hypothetical protein